MSEYCDNKSVGVIVTHQESTLLLHRAKYPFGLAAPAGHIDDHGTAEQAAVAEVYEEVGITLRPSSLKPILINQRINNTCRRVNGDHHIWTVYQAEADSKEFSPSVDETRGAAWYGRAALATLLDHSTQHSQPIKQCEAIIEPVWLDFFALFLNSRELNDI